MTRIVLPLVLALATGGPAAAQDNEQNPVTIGVLAKRGSERCLEKWGPTADYLTDQIAGHSFVVVLLGYEDVCPAVERGEVDFILANPALYVELERLHGASRIATLKNRPGDKAHTVYGGVIFRRADRKDIETLRDLRGKTFMAVDEASFGGWLAAWRELKAHGIDPHRDFADLQFGGTHDAVVYAVRDGKVDAGSVRTDTLERMAREDRIRLDAFQVFDHDHSGKDPSHFHFPHSTDTYPEWPFASLEHTSDALAERVAVALLGMPADSPAAKAARCAGWTVPLNYQPVHECLKELRAGPYEDYGTATFKNLVTQYWPWLAAAAAFLALAGITTLSLLRLNRRLTESKEKYCSLIANIPDVAWTADSTGRTSFISPDVEKVCGFTPEEIYTAGDRVWLGRIHPDDIGPVRTAFERLFATGEPFDVEYRIQRKDGTWIWLHDRGITTYERNDVKYADGVFSDITERKRAEKKLRESEDRFRSLVEATSDWVWEVDQNSAYTYASPKVKDLLGYAPEDVIGKTPFDFMPPAEAERAAKLLRDIVESRQPFAGLENTNLRKDGQPVLLETSGVPILDAGGNVLGYRGIDRDITERKRADETVRMVQVQLLAQQQYETERVQTELEKVRDELVRKTRLATIGQVSASIAHELRNPLGTIRNAAYYLKRHAADGPPKLTEHLGIIEQETGAADRIIGNLMEMTRAREPIRQAADLGQIVREVLDRANLPEEIRWRVSLDPDPFVLDLDPGQLRQVLANLLTNAVQAMGEQGEIRVAGSRSAEYNMIVFGDSGPGVTPGLCARLFEPLVTTKAKGIGLGLTICRQIVERHGGTIELMDDNERGAAFRVRLPRQAAPGNL